MDQNLRILKNALGLLWIRHEVRRQVALVKAHALDIFKSGVGGLAFLNFDNAIGADSINGFGDQLAKVRVMVGAHGRNFLKIGATLALLRHFNQRIASGGGRKINSALQSDGIHRARDKFQTTIKDGGRKNRGGGGAITSDVGGFLCHLMHKLGAHVLERTWQLNFLGNADAVLGHAWIAE